MKTRVSGLTEKGQKKDGKKRDYYIPTTCLQLVIPKDLQWLQPASPGHCCKNHLPADTRVRKLVDNQKDPVWQRTGPVLIIFLLIGEESRDPHTL